MTVPLSPALLVLLQGSPTNALYQQIFMFGSIFLIFYFLILRPQQKQRKTHEEMLRKLKKGDEVVTAGGVVGEVVHIKETMKDGQPTRAMDDRVTIKSGESRLIVERGRIARVVSASGATSSAPAER